MDEIDEQIATNGNGVGHPGPTAKGDRFYRGDESREEKFVRLALQRMPNVKKHMRLVSNLASYPHTDAQRDKIISELRKLVAEVEAAFAPSRRDDSFRF